MKNDTIGNRTRDLPICSAVAHPTAAPRAAVCIGSYLKSVLGYKFLILGTYHPDTLREQGCEEPWLFVEAKRGPRAKKVREALRYM
jgi:hypothetical protein